MRRALYRVRQFVQYAGARLSPAEQQAVEDRLGPALAALFQRMTPAEQAHSHRVAQKLLRQGHSEPDLIAAALLHDVGKTRSPLALWERTLVVLVEKAAPSTAERLGQAEGEPQGLRRPFVTAQCHAAWGAEMAEAAGATRCIVSIIRRHQSPPAGLDTEEDRWLIALKQADEES